MASGPGMMWPMIALIAGLVGWLATIAARNIHARGGVAPARVLLACGIVLSIAGAGGGLAGPWISGLDPQVHSYPAIVWTLAIWTSAHAGVAAIMQSYALARSLAGKMDPHHDADLRNVSVYMHFYALTAIVTYATIGLFPEVA
tara:strand:- start:314 stop:745 length:432 start_codon:yes stop_codon:yes gene_type:complete